MGEAMNRDKTLNSMQNMLKITRNYTHCYSYKGSTSYENTFKSVNVLDLFQKLEQQNQVLHELLIKNKAFDLEIVNNSLKNTENIDVKCMQTIKSFKNELENFLKNKTLTIEQLNKAENSGSIKMDFKYQAFASEYLNETRIDLMKFEKDLKDLDNLIHFINLKNPNELCKYDLELEELYKKIES